MPGLFTKTRDGVNERPAICLVIRASNPGLFGTNHTRVTGEQLAERTVPPSDLSLLGLVRHMTKVERAWFRQRFAGEPVDSPFRTTRRPSSRGPTRPGPRPTTPG